MGRPKAFDPETALDRAVRAFWLNGYEATSLGALIDTMGISKSSFYDTFGSKHALFLTSLDRYAATTVAAAVAVLESDKPGRDAIARVFRDAAARFADNDEPPGCFLSNAAAEMAPRCPETRVKVHDLFLRMEAAFKEAVQRGQKDGSISPTHDARALARFLTASLNGLQVIGKAGPDDGSLTDTVKTVSRLLA